jgi:hypothetical protein
MISAGSHMLCPRQSLRWCAEAEHTCNIISLYMYMFVTRIHLHMFYTCMHMIASNVIIYIYITQCVCVRACVFVVFMCRSSIHDFGRVRRGRRSTPQSTSQCPGPPARLQATQKLLGPPGPTCGSPLGFIAHEIKLVGIPTYHWLVIYC